jgi:predicted CoA-binding protein
MQDAAEGIDMGTVARAAEDFLGQRRIAVAGVSREPAAHGGNVVYKRLRERGYEVFAVNPNADSVEGDACYHDLASIPGGVDAVVVATNPRDTPSVVEECEALGITRVWLHRSFGRGSVDEAAVVHARAAGMTVIAGGCPLMFEPASDAIHRCMGWVVGHSGSRPTAG